MKRIFRIGVYEIKNSRSYSFTMFENLDYCLWWYIVDGRDIPRWQYNNNPVILCNISFETLIITLKAALQDFNHAAWDNADFVTLVVYITWIRHHWSINLIKKGIFSKYIDDDEIPFLKGHEKPRSKHQSQLPYDHFLYGLIRNTCRRQLGESPDIKLIMRHRSAIELVIKTFSAPPTMYIMDQMSKLIKSMYKCNTNCFNSNDLSILAAACGRLQDHKKSHKLIINRIEDIIKKIEHPKNKNFKEELENVFAEMQL